MNNGRERFEPSRIEFPLIIKKKELPQPKAVICGKNQVEMFDDPINSESEQYQEVIHSEKHTYVDWLEQQIDLNQYVFGEEEYEQ